MKGDLDGILIVRYAHRYSDVGGVSHHLFVLNRTLLARNQTEIHQSHPAVGSRIETSTLVVPNGLGSFHSHPIVVSEPAARTMEAPPTTSPRRKPDQKGFLGQLGRTLRMWAFDARWIDVSRHLPGLTRGANLRLEIPDALARLLPQLRDNHPGKRLLYVDHSPHNSYAAQRILAARNAGYTPLAIYHGGFVGPASRNLRYLPRGVGRGAVTLEGHAGEMGCNPRCLGNGIDTAFFDPALADRTTSRCHLGFHDHEPVLLLPASLIKAKGHLELTEAVLRLHQKHGWQNTVVLFAGASRHPEFKLQLEEAARNVAFKSGARFQITNHLTPEALRDAYAAADIVVLPSHTEGVPRVVLEAQAMGIPVVATNVGGTREALIDRQTGLLVPPGDVNALATALHEMHQIWRSGLHRPQLARGFVDANYGLNALAERHEKFYLEALQCHA